MEPHEHTPVSYEMCEACIGYGVVVRTLRDGKTMRVENVPCPNCEGLGILRETERIEGDEHEDGP